jgi:hypothetical protein
MRIGQVLRYGQARSPKAPVVDGLPNFFFETVLPGSPIVAMERGIGGIAEVKTVDGLRRPAVMIRSSPHRVGSEATPWQDFFDPDHGHIRYFGDNKPSTGVAPEGVVGNKILLQEFARHQSTDLATRRTSTPLLFFLSVPHEGRVKGNVKFQGFGIVERAELVSQWDVKAERSFPNYRFDFAVLGLAEEGEEFDWKWINARRDKELSLDATLELAPASWKKWMRGGQAHLERVRRRVAQLRTVKEIDQRPPPGSKEEKVLNEIYAFYDKGKHRFEGLAELVAERVIRATGANYRSGWITPASSDGGADFIGRVDVGDGFGSAKLVVLGQAKCEKLDRATGGNHIARTAARLRRGWIGVYVTTSYFSRRSQEEVIEDEYPLVLVNGVQVADAVLQMTREAGFADTASFLTMVDAGYTARVRSRRPSEILLD